MAVGDIQLPYGDGSTKLYGMENFGNTCYCNSILQCLYYTTKFRRHVLTHNTTPHERKTDMPGASPHAYTMKYEQLLAKKLKERGKVATSVGSEVSAGSAVPSTQKPSIRNSLFGKFSGQSTIVLNPEEVGVSSVKARSCIREAGQCEALSIEQRLIIRKNPDFSHLQLLVTRPSSTTSTDSINESSATSTTLLDSGSSSNNSTLIADSSPVTTRSSFVVIGIPNPEPGLPVPINPFSSNPTSDHRKRSALINGPILNLDHALSLSSEKEDKCLLYSLKDIFESMGENSSQIGIVSPSYFIRKLKEKNFLFRQANMHHDAHEFCNYLINEIIETVNLELGQSNNWCTEVFQGIITNETKCLFCESVTSKDETFLDLSVDIPPGESAYSLTFSLNNFSKSEVLNHQNKFYCNTCSSLQEAVKTIKLKKTPQVLVINFKRFKYDDKLDRMVKLFDSISYPLKLRLFNITSGKSEGESNNTTGTHSDIHGDDFCLYSLYALVVHIGGGPTHGHYVALCKCQAGLWFLFDDETLEIVDDSYVLRFFGNGPGLASAYMLFYEKIENTSDDDGLDFGIDLDDIYNGEDYSLATMANSPDEHELSEKLSLETKSESKADYSVDSGKTIADTSMEKSTSRTASILKKTFMFDSKDGERVKESANSIGPKSTKLTNNEPAPNVQKPGTWGEKKSWVDGLKRRESRPELNVEERGGPTSTVPNSASVNTVASGIDEANPEKMKRKNSLFSFMKKNKL